MKQTKRNPESGLYTVLAAMLLPLFIALLGLAIDMAHYWWAQSHLQNAADAAALAGAKDLNGTTVGRTSATSRASTYAARHKVDGAEVQPGEVIENVTGNWNFDTASFSSAGVSDAAANAIRVTVRREDVPTFFAKFLPDAAPSQTLSATAVSVAGGTRSAPCAAPVAMASCSLSYDSAGKLVCPSNLSFQNGAQSVGLTHPDGSSPVNGANTDPFFTALMANPNTCTQPADLGDTLYLQNGNDLKQSSVDTINAATQNGLNPVSVVLPVVDMGPSCPSGANYNQNAKIVGFLKMKFVGGRWTDAAPTAVAAACPTIGKKNICITADCSYSNDPAVGSSINARIEKTYLVN